MSSDKKKVSTFYLILFFLLFIILFFYFIINKLQKEKILALEPISINLLTSVNPNLKWTFTDKDIQSKSQNSPILGMELLGKVLVTINKGYISCFKS